MSTLVPEYRKILKKIAYGAGWRKSWPPTKTLPENGLAIATTDLWQQTLRIGQVLGQTKKWAQMAVEDPDKWTIKLAAMGEGITAADVVSADAREVLYCWGSWLLLVEDIPDEELSDYTRMGRTLIREYISTAKVPVLPAMFEEFDNSWYTQAIGVMQALRTQWAYESLQQMALKTELKRFNDGLGTGDQALPIDTRMVLPAASADSPS